MQIASNDVDNCASMFFYCRLYEKRNVFQQLGVVCAANDIVRAVGLKPEMRKVIFARNRLNNQWFKLYRVSFGLFPRSLCICMTMHRQLPSELRAHTHKHTHTCKRIPSSLWKQMFMRNKFEYGTRDRFVHAHRCFSNRCRTYCISFPCLVVSFIDRTFGS